MVGIHNVIIVNDDELLDGHACARLGRMTVDSEAILRVIVAEDTRAGGPAAVH